MARKFLTPVDLTKNEIQNVVIQNLASAPSSPVKGQMYFNSTGGDNTMYWYDGSGWVAAKAPSTSGITQGDADIRYLNTTGDTATGLLTTADLTVSGTLTASGPNNLNGTTTITTLSSPNPVSVGTPSGPTDAATKTYVDNLSAGLAWKDAVRAATTANITLSAPQTVDGVAVIAGERVLVKNQSTASQNGIYVVAAGAWTRATDSDTDQELLNATVFVSEGTTQADTAWTMTTNLPITVNTTNLTWVQFGAGQTYVAGGGLTLTTNTLAVGAGTGITVNADDVAITAAGVSNTLLATMPANTFKGNNTAGVAAPTDVTVANMQTALAIPALPVTVANGGTGRATATTAYGLIAAGTTATGVQQTVSPGTAGHFLKSAGASALASFAAIAQADVANLTTDLAARTRKYSLATVGGATSQVITHNLATRDVVVDVYRTTTPWDTVECDVERTDTNNVTLRFAVAPSANEYSVVVIG